MRKLAVFLLCLGGVARAETPPSVPFIKRAVVIYSDGVRMAADLYSPDGLTPMQKVPAVVLCNGTGGTKAKVTSRTAAEFAKQGFVALAFDYRGWGESDSKLITLEPQPRPDPKGNVQVSAQAVRWQMNYADQTEDIRAALAFLLGEPNVDPQKTGLWGSSYGGGLVVWVAGNDARVNFVIAQVAGMGRNTPAADGRAQKQATQQARGEIEPVPFTTGKLGGKMASYEMMRTNPVRSQGYHPLEAATKIHVPALIIDAEKDELMDISQHGAKAAAILREQKCPVEYHVISGISHYGVYREKYREVTDLELAWLKKISVAVPTK